MAEINAHGETFEFDPETDLDLVVEWLSDKIDWTPDGERIYQVPRDASEILVDDLRQTLRYVYGLDTLPEPEPEEAVDG